MVDVIRGMFGTDHGDILNGLLPNIRIFIMDINCSYKLNRLGEVEAQIPRRVVSLH